MSPVAGSSSYPTHDYTEGASAIDIEEAIANTKRSRRDSQYSTYLEDDEGGAMFSGPGHSVNPSSVSRMSNLEFGRRSSDDWSRARRKSHDSLGSRRRSSRRSSVDSQVSRQSINGDGVPGEPDENSSLLSDDGRSGRSGDRKHHKSLPSPQRHSVFENIANLFGRSTAGDQAGHRRFSISQRSSTSRLSRGSRRSRRSADTSEHAVDSDEGEERWGYSSAEEEESEEEPVNVMRDNASASTSMEYDSEPSTPTEPTQNLPLLAMDSVFGGEARIDMDVSFTLLDAPPPGPPSRQTIYIADEDSTIRFIGYEVVWWRAWLWNIGCIFSLGILALLGHWFPRLWLLWVAHEKAFIDSHNGFVVVEVRIMISPPILAFLRGASLLTEQLHYSPSVIWIIIIIYLRYYPSVCQSTNAPSCVGRAWSRRWTNISIPRMVF